MIDKIIMVYPNEFVGVKAVAMNGSELGFWEAISLKDAINLQDPKKHILLGAWHKEYRRLIGSWPESKFNVYLTSTLAQMEFSGELSTFFGFVFTTHNLPINNIFVGSKLISKIFSITSWLPYPISLQMQTYKDIASIYNTKSKYILFLSPFEPRKNAMVQLAGFLLSRLKNKEIIMRTNAPIITLDRIEQVNWLPRYDMFRLIRNSLAMLNCFFSESLSYSTIECIDNGTIPIISPSIKSALELGNEFDTIVCQNIDNPINICNLIIQVANMNKSQYSAIIERLGSHLEHLANSHNTELKKILEDKLLAIE